MIAPCPNCHSRPTRTEGVWSRTELPRVVWTCPTCKGTGEVDVQLARSRTMPVKDGTWLRPCIPPTGGRT